VTLPISADFSTFLSFDNKVDFGLSYRTNSSFSVMTFIKIFDNLNLGYAYEFPVETNLRNLSVNTHELLLQFRFRSSDNSSNKIEDLKNYNPLEKNFDRDNDQVLDQDDKCPDSPGPKSNFGCPLPPNTAFQNVRSNINDKADELKKLELQSTENDFSFLQTEEYTIYFDFDDFKIKGELNFSKLKKYIKLIKENQNLVFVIEGYSSSEGDENYNKKLSEQRALSVENFLIGSGISKNQIKIVGFGEDFSELSSSSSEKKKERKVKLNLLLKGN
jgi:outer membrane protein OmpA-like peptidoglycan-associated protein